jgi:hypothetical protein
MLSFIPFVANGIHMINNGYTSFLLQLAYQVPTEVDSYLNMEPFHPFWLILYFCSVCLAGIVWKEKTHAQENSFAFI